MEWVNYHLEKKVESSLTHKLYEGNQNRTHSLTTQIHTPLSTIKRTSIPSLLH